MKTKLKYLLLTAVLLGDLCQANAQATAFTYQGRLNDGASPATGTYDLQFTLYNNVTNGLFFGTLTNSVTGITNGLFTTTLDFGPGVFTGSNYWLEISVRTNGGSAFATLAPRQPVTPSPYALFAPNAGAAATAVVAGSANSVAAANVTGTIADSQLSSNVARLNVPNTNIQATASAVILSGFIVGTTNLMGERAIRRCHW
jgi:hypothetical protein